MPHSKRMKTALGSIEPAGRYTLADAVVRVKANATAKFDETIDLAVRLGVDPKHADQMVRGACSLPHGTGKTVRLVVFAQGAAVAAALAAGADFVGGDELVEKINTEGWVDFDKVIAARDMMGKVGKLGKVLGPRGLMPNPKVGTVVPPENIAEAVAEQKKGKVDFRVEKSGIVHCAFAKASMSETQILDNLTMLMTTIVKLKPSTAKGIYLKSITVSSTMGPGVRIDPLDAQRVADAV
jgi:large subunit ribosomal protein L1